MMGGFNIPLSSIHGIGPKTTNLFKELGIFNVGDLLEYYPRTYQDRSKITKISQLKGKGRETIVATVTKHLLQGKIKRVCLSDGTSSCFLLFFGNFKEEFLPLGRKIIVSGYAKRFRTFFQFSNFEYEILDKDAEISGIVPLYRLSSSWGRLGQRLFRRIIKRILEIYKDKIPDYFKPNGFISQKEAILNIHFPNTWDDYKRARNRLAFNELFLLQLGFLINKKRLSLILRPGYPKVEEPLSFPFELTNAQKRAIKEIEDDLSSSHPMNRLLHGDVGSGKTAVCLSAAYRVAKAGFQVAIMAPTEILCEQHYLSAKRLLSPYGIKVGILRSGLGQKEQNETKKMIENGEIKVVIGTHALIQSDVKFKNLSFCIIDEQHRFGVSQREALMKKASRISKTFCDLLIMTATPIPRTIALSLYGDMDISVLDEMPKNRGKVITTIRANSDLPKIYNFIKERINEGEQAYIVYPVIDEGDKTRWKSCKVYFKKLCSIFKDSSLALLHGRLKPDEKEAIMKGFLSGNIQILVSTTVIEVGIDVSNATIMVIEDSERFGLSQLHQLRGRIGRGKRDSYCILIAKDDVVNAIRNNVENGENKDTIERLKTFVKIHDGFVLSEYDLKQRGTGELFGERQHGISELKIADPLRDYSLLVKAKHEAEAYLRKDPLLQENQPLKDLLLKTFKNLSLGIVR